MKIGRNDPCYCRSGKKYKNCHELKNQSKNNQYYVIGIIAVVIFAVLSINSGDSNSRTNLPTTSNSILQKNQTSINTKKSNLAPPGKVWHEEHGHFHDAPRNTSLTPKPLVKEKNNKITIPPTDKNNPPPGKVWHEKHGHFHDE